MKQFIAFLAAIALMATSCTKTDLPNQDPSITAALQYTNPQTGAVVKTISFEISGPTKQGVLDSLAKEFETYRDTEGNNLIFTADVKKTNIWLQYADILPIIPNSDYTLEHLYYDAPGNEGEKQDYVNRKLVFFSYKN